MAAKDYGTGVVAVSGAMTRPPLAWRLKDIFQAALYHKDRRGYTPLHEKPKRAKFKPRNRKG